jgi:hypothetical protein
MSRVSIEFPYYGKGGGKERKREDYLPFDRSPELDEADA